MAAGGERKDLATWFGDVAEKEKGDVHTLDDCYTSTIVILAMAVGLFLDNEFSRVIREVGVRASFDHGPELGFLAKGVANDPEAHQRIESVWKK